MNTIFIIRLIASFVVGGAFIAVLSLIAERVNKKIAGPILALPSTVAVSLFFIALTTSTKTIAEIAPTSILANGVTQIFVLTYLYTSKVSIKKTASIAASASLALIVWFLLAVPLAIYKFSDLWIGFAGFTLAASLCYYFVSIKPRVISEAIKMPFTRGEVLTRALFGGSIVALAVLLSKLLSPFWGGILSSFPGVFLTTLIILHRKHNSDFLFRTFHNIPAGMFVTVFFTTAAAYTFPAFGLTGGFLLAYLVAIVVLGVHYAIFKRTT
ncbi:MAG: hypothetical protein A3C90_03920 [Candidatus Magasanikbacteria bacterium RIFCSPHIGHO2_02_FULL_51_14]|uniref:DUF3147 family protein n=1 Tax=Candidatus Magasanikbacteria bacterium RIFCSPHIGHO2_02_FULL_51_14 TaxID=1798683 RepID=A0A1F6MP53_9BACT|nr:MAG: hypothetical protein A3C90_03920 [Candidatus Magasanikbacteria bacterium RIFCSPHIGHO2_02_FULL_51_14]